MDGLKRLSLFIVFAVGLLGIALPATTPVVMAGPLAKAHTYFTCEWHGTTVRLKHVTEVNVERYRDAVRVGACKNLKTNDRYYSRLIGKSINVFVAWGEYPGLYVVHNGLQGKQPVMGAWTFSVDRPAGLLTGTVTDSATQAVLPGATVTASLCQEAPTHHCTIETTTTNAKGVYSLTVHVAGSYSVVTSLAGYSASAAATVAFSGGKSVLVNVALTRAPQATSLTLSSNPAAPTVGQSVTLTATLGQSISDGPVSFTGTGPVGTTFSPLSCTPVNGTCSVTWQPPATGAWIISAAWPGDASYQAVADTAHLTVSPSLTPSSLTLTAKPALPALGQTTQITATLNAGAVGGLITFTGSGPNSAVFTTQSCAPSNGSCTISWTPSVAGSWAIDASWSGNTQYQPTSSSLQATVNGLAATTLALLASPATLPVGQPGSITMTLGQPVNDGSVTVSFSGPAGSTVVGSQSCVPANGSCTIVWIPSGPGTWTVVANWSGDSQYATVSNSTTVTATAPATPVALSVTASPTSPGVGTNTTLTAKLSFSVPVNDGTVSFTGIGPGSATFPSQTCTPLGSECSITWSPTINGIWSITALWSGGTEGTATVTTIQINVGGTGGATTINLGVVASPNTLRVNHPDTVTATLDQPVNDGTITFSFTGPTGSTPVANKTCTPTNGTCSVSWTPTATGNWTVSTQWSGDTQYNANAQSTTVSVTPQGYLTLTASPNPVIVNAPLTLQVHLQTPSDTPVSVSGTSTSGGSYNGTCTANASNGGTCTLTFSPNVSGLWTFSALFVGDTVHTTQETDTTQVTVTGAPTSLTLAENPNPLNLDQTGTVTSTILGTSPAVNDGTVTFDFAGPSGSTTVPDSTCSVTAAHCSAQWSPTAPGAWTITATWSGDAGYQPATSSIQVTVNNTQLFTVTENSTLPINQTGTATAQFDTQVDSGTTVTFTFAGPNGSTYPTQTCSPTLPNQATTSSCQVAWQPNALGTWTITGTWTGDSTHAGPVTASVAVNVVQQALTLVVSTSPTPTHGQDVTLTATLFYPPPSNGQPASVATAVNGGRVIFSGQNTTTGQQSLPSDLVCTIQAGSCHVTWPGASVNAGNWLIAASWAGGAGYGPSGGSSTVPVS